MSAEVSRPILRYFGGKWVLAPWIISQMPQHRIYCEPYGGGGSVLLRKPRAHSEVYNDIDGDIVNVFRALQTDPEELRRRLTVTPFAREEYDLAYQPSDDPIERARRTIIRSLMGFGGNSTGAVKTGFRTTSVQTNRVPSLDWVNYPAEIGAWVERLKRVVLEHRDGKEVMEAQDSPETLHFVDPPYLHDTRNIKHGYRFEMTVEEHEELVSFLEGLTGMVMLCGYHNPIYDRLGWETREQKALADGARERTEVLWLNPACIKAQSQMSLFGSVTC